MTDARVTGGLTASERFLMRTINLGENNKKVKYSNEETQKLISCIYQCDVEKMTS